MMKYFYIDELLLDMNVMSKIYTDVFEDTNHPLVSFAMTVSSHTEIFFLKAMYKYWCGLCFGILF